MQQLVGGEKGETTGQEAHRVRGQATGDSGNQFSARRENTYSGPILCIRHLRTTLNPNFSPEMSDVDRIF